MSDIHTYGLFGLVYLAFGIGMVTYPKSAKRLAMNLEHEPIALYMGGVMAIAIGYFLIIIRQGNSGGWSHNLLTAMGYAALIKGLVILMLPDKAIRYSQKLMHTDFEVQFLGLFMMILGLICGLMAVSL